MWKFNSSFSLAIIILLLQYNCLAAQNPAAALYGNGSYPVWTDDIRWNNRINMQTFDFVASGCAECATQFRKFEFARDLLHQQGGGVLYYPAGTYDFSDLTDEISDGNAGRGLMLRSGVVILGETPSAGNALNGNLQPVTKFLFKKKKIADINSQPRSIPVNWNLIGCIPSSGETLRDVINIGVLWIELQGGVIYFGAEFPFAATYSAGIGWYSNKASKGEWKNRIPDGTHPFDPFASASGNYLGAGSGRIVMGCVIRDGVLGNHNIIQYAKEKYDTIAQSTYPYKFGARIGVYGKNVLVSNNYLPKSDSCFKYYQTTAITQADKCNQAFGNRRSVLIYDYGKSVGIDVNKGFLNPFTNTLPGYLHENVIIADNKVYNHGNKGFEISGNWLLVKNNKNDRDFLGENADRYGLGTGWELTLDGFYESVAGGNGCLSDNLSRAFDMAGKNGWIDNNTYSNTGSSPGNDGEGILWQAHGGMNSIMSFAITNNNGSGYMAGYDVHHEGALWAWNTTSSVGNYKAGSMTDAAIVSNVGTIKTTGTDVLTACPSDPPSAPTTPEVTLASNNEYVNIRWTDTSNNEIGFRVERKDGNNPWKTLAIRPRRSNGSANNEQVWRDYLYPKGVIFSYRVVAVDCKNDDTSASGISASLAVGLLTNKSNATVITPVFSKNKIVFTDNQISRKIIISDLAGRTLKSGIHSGGDMDISFLSSGLYIITIYTSAFNQSYKFVK